MKLNRVPRPKITPAIARLFPIIFELAKLSPMIIIHIDKFEAMLTTGTSLERSCNHS